MIYCAGIKQPRDQSFSPPVEKCVGYSLKNLGPLGKLFTTHGVSNWLRAWVEAWNQQTKGLSYLANTRTCITCQCNA